MKWAKECVIESIESNKFISLGDPIEHLSPDRMDLMHVVCHVLGPYDNICWITIPFPKTLGLAIHLVLVTHLLIGMSV